MNGILMFPLLLRVLSSPAQKDSSQLCLTCDSLPNSQVPISCAKPDMCLTSFRDGFHLYDFRVFYRPRALTTCTHTSSYRGRGFETCPFLDRSTTISYGLEVVSGRSVW